MKHFVTVSMGVLVVLSSIAVLAQQQSATGFKNAKAKSAQIKFDRAMQKLEQEFQQKVAALRSDYANELRQVQSELTKANNLDEAVVIRDTIRDLEALAKPQLPKNPPKAEAPEEKKEPVAAAAKKHNPQRSETLQNILDKADRWRESLVGARFNCPGGEMQFNADGSVSVAGAWADQNLQWHAATADRALLYYPKRNETFQVLTMEGDKVQAWTFQKDWTGERTK